MQNIEKLREILKIANDGLTKEEFLANFQLVLDTLKKNKEFLSKEINSKTSKAVQDLEEFLNTAKEAIEKIEDDNKAGISNIKKWAIDKVNTLYAQSGVDKLVENKLNQVDKKLAEIDIPELSTIAKEASELAFDELKALIPSKVVLEEEIPKLGESIVDAINLLPTSDNQDKIDIEHIRGLRDELDRILRIAESKQQVFGGGAGLPRTTRVYGEVYTATDGQTDFSTLYPFVNGTLQVCRGGARQNPSGNYTISGQTVSFTIPLQAGEEVLFDYER